MLSYVVLVKIPTQLSIESPRAPGLEGSRAPYESGAIGQFKRLLAVFGWLRNSRQNHIVIGRAVLTFGGLKAVPLFQTHIFADLYSLRNLSNAESHRAFGISPYVVLWSVTPKQIRPSVDRRFRIDAQILSEVSRIVRRILYLLADLFPLYVWTC